MTQIYIPDEVTAGFLMRLPLKSLVRFIVVCKSWNSIITSPSFIATHLNRNLSKSEDPCFLNVYHRLGVLLSEKTLTMRAGFELPYVLAETQIIGSCKGLLSLKISYGIGEGIFLYNPWIQHLKVVENFRNSELNSLPNVLYGFGYVERSNDHRLVKVQDLPGNKVAVYSLSTNSWHELQQSPPGRLLASSGRSSTGLYFNGATHWCISIEVDHDLYFLDSIVAFDFTEEVFRDILLPDELKVDVDEIIHMNEFQGSLALFVSNRFFSQHTTSDLWVMSEYGVSESWSRKFRVCFSDIYKEPIGFTKNGSVVLLRNGFGDIKQQYLVLYSLQTGRYKHSEHNLAVKYIFDFTESLLLLDHKNQLWKYQDRDHGNRLFYWNLE